MASVQFYGAADFFFKLDDIRNVTSTLVGSVLRVTATIWDWEFLEEKTNVATSTVIDSGAYIRFLGGAVRTFKPGQSLDVYVSAFYSQRFATLILLNIPMLAV